MELPAEDCIRNPISTKDDDSASRGCEISTGALNASAPHSIPELPPSATSVKLEISNVTQEGAFTIHGACDEEIISRKDKLSPVPQETWAGTVSTDSMADPYYPASFNSADCAVGTDSTESSFLFRKHRLPTTTTMTTLETAENLSPWSQPSSSWGKPTGPIPTRIYMDHFPDKAPDGDPSARGRSPPPFSIAFPCPIYPLELRYLEEETEKIEVGGIEDEIDRFLDINEISGQEYHKFVQHSEKERALLFKSFRVRVFELDTLKENLKNFGPDKRDKGLAGEQDERRILQEPVQKLETELSEISRRLFQHRAQAEDFVTSYMKWDNWDEEGGDHDPQRKKSSSEDLSDFPGWSKLAPRVIEEDPAFAGAAAFFQAQLRMSDKGENSSSTPQAPLPIQANITRQGYQGAGAHVQGQNVYLEDLDPEPSPEKIGKKVAEEEIHPPQIMIPQWFKLFDRSDIVFLLGKSPEQRFCHLSNIIAHLEDAHAVQMAKSKGCNTDPLFDDDGQHDAPQKLWDKNWHEPGSQWAPNRVRQEHGGWWKCRTNKDAPKAELQCSLCHSREALSRLANPSPESSERQRRHQSQPQGRQSQQRRSQLATPPRPTPEMGPKEQLNIIMTRIQKCMAAVAKQDRKIVEVRMACEREDADRSLRDSNWKWLGGFCLPRQEVCRKGVDLPRGPPYLGLKAESSKNQQLRRW